MTTGIYQNPVDMTNLVAKVDHQIKGNDLFNVKHSLADVTSANSRGAGGLNAPSASAALDNIDQAMSISNTLTLSPRTVNETTGAIHLQRSRGAANRSRRTGREHCRRGDLRHAVGESSRPARTRCFRSSTACRISAARTRCERGMDFIYNHDTITYPRAYRGSYTFSSMANFLAGIYNNAGFTQTFAQSVVSQTNPNLGFYAQDEWKAASRLTLNAGVRYDLQFLETIETDRNNLSPRFGVAWVPDENRATVIRGSAGLFFDRVPLRALANAILSAHNTTDLEPAGANQREFVAELRPARPCSEHPAGCGAERDARQLRDHGSSDAERLLAAGEHRSGAAVERTGHLQRRLPARARAQPDHDGQPERADLRRVRQQQRLPAQSQLREQQPVFARGVFELPRAARVVRAAPDGHGAASA